MDNKNSAGQRTCNNTRRQFMWEMGAGFAGVALTAMLDSDGFFASRAAAAENPLIDPNNPFAPRPQHFPAKAKRCIFLYMHGGPSAMESFDYKPALNGADGKKVSGKTLLEPECKFEKRGQSGLWCSDLFPNMGKHVDKMAVLKSLYCDSNAHGQSMLQMNTGRIIQGSPSLGTWLSYGLGTENQNLPSYVVMLGFRKNIIGGTLNWGNGYMPAAHQGTVIHTNGEPINSVTSPSGISRTIRRQQIDTLAALNAQHQKLRPEYDQLQARIASYELAYQLQSAAPEALDLKDETAETRKMYGLDAEAPKNRRKEGRGMSQFGHQCIYARRLVERGVRFVQCYSDGWDAHSKSHQTHISRAAEVDQPIGALLTDLEQRGLLDETLVVWGGEFGRLPFQQNKDRGRGHNSRGFLYWMAGGGVKPGTSYGETDELGYKAVEKQSHVRDLHATILHLMGLDHEKLSYFYGGFDQRLTGPKDAHVMKEIIA